MSTSTDRKSYTAGHFELQLDGKPTTAYLKSVDGGYMRHAVVDEPIGPNNLRIKHSSVADIDPISFDFGLSGANSVLQWIQASWNKDYGRRSGQITHANFNMQPTLEHQFSDALITETTFPALDGASKEAAYVKVKFQPEQVNITKASSKTPLKATMGAKQKLWLCSGFRLHIDGVEGMEYANKIESFTIKQSIKKLLTGMHRFPQIEPTKIDFPNISGTISLEYADGVLAWYDKYISKGIREGRGQKWGALEFLSPDRAKVLFRITLKEVGLTHASVSQSTANTDQIKRVKFELFVGKMELDGTFGME